MSADLKAKFEIKSGKKINANFSLGTPRGLSTCFSLGEKTGIKIEGKGSISVEFINGRYIISQFTYIHEQAIPSNEWVIVHNLEKKPSVVVVDTAGNLIICDVVYDSLNQLTLIMNSNVKGKAYLN